MSENACDDAVERIKRLSGRGRLETSFKFLTGDIEVTSFGFGSDGVNTVLRATDRQNENNTVIMKLAMPIYQDASFRTDFQGGASYLEREYNKISALYTKMPSCLPKALLYDKDEQIVLLEYPRDYSVLWTQLQDGSVDKVAIQQLAKLLSDLHNIKSVAADTASCQHQEYNRNEELANLIFVQPYRHNDASKESGPGGIKKALLDRVHGNARLKAAVDGFKSVYEERRDSLIHGDLHLGNVIAHQGHSKLLNFTFMRNGPRSFDLGLLLAGYMAMYHFHMLIPEDNDEHRRISYKMMDACRSTVETYLSEMSQAQRPEDLLEEIAGFAGCELIRRAIGSNPYPRTEYRPEVLTEMLESGLRLLLVYHPITDIGRLLMIALALC